MGLQEHSFPARNLLKRFKFCVLVLVLSSTFLPCTALRLAAFGDYGWAGPDEQAVANMVKAWNVDDILALGDNNYNDGLASTIDDNNQYYTGFMYPYSGAYGTGAASRTNHFWPIPGNHDWSLNCGDGRSSCTGQCSYSPGSATANSYIAPYLQYFAGAGGKLYYTTVLGGGLVQLFALDADCSEPDGTTSTSIQGTWLKNQLAASTARWKIVMLHQSPFSSGDHGSFPRLQWPFQAWGADAVLSGHDHGYERILKNVSFPYFVNGIGGASLYAFGTRVAGSAFRYNAQYGAQLITVNTTTATFRLFSAYGANAYSNFKDCYRITKVGSTTSYTSACTGVGASTEGFESTVASPSPSPKPSPSPSPSPTTQPSPSPSPKPAPSPSPNPATASPSPAPQPSPSPSPKPSPSPSPKPSPSPSPSPAVQPSPSPSPCPSGNGPALDPGFAPGYSPTPSTSPSPSPKPSPSPSPSPAPQPSPSPAPKPSPSPSPSPSPQPPVSPSPKTPSPSPSPQPSPSPAPPPSPSPQTSPSPSPQPASSPAPGGITVSDWADLTDGLAGHTITYGSTGLMVGCVMTLKGSTAPIIMTNDNDHAIMAAARVSSGRLVAFNMEDYFELCDWEPALCNGDSGRLIINSLRWAAQKAVPAAGGRVTLRLAVHQNDYPYVLANTPMFNDFATYAATLGVDIVKPTGKTSWFLNDPTLLGTGTSAIADVFLTTTWDSFTLAQRTAIQTFVQSGGGMVIGGEGWSWYDAGYTMASMPGNKLLAPLNVLAWTEVYTDADYYPPSVIVGTMPPWVQLAAAAAAVAAQAAPVGGRTHVQKTEGRKPGPTGIPQVIPPAQTVEPATETTAAVPPAPPVPGPLAPTTPLPTALSADAAPSITTSAAPPDPVAVQQPAAAMAALPPAPQVPEPTEPTAALPTDLTAPIADPQDPLATQQPSAATAEGLTSMASALPSADLNPLSQPLSEVPAGQSSSGGARRLLRQKKAPADRQLRKMKLAQPHPIVPDEAENLAERERVRQSVSNARDKLTNARANPRAAFAQAMQQATASGFGDKLSGRDRQARYDIFLANLQEAESRNAQAVSEDEVYMVDKFSVFTKQELQAMRRFPVRGGRRKMLYNNPSMPLTCACGQPTERPFQYATVDVTNVPATTWKAYMTPVRDQQASNACGMFAVTAVLEAGFYRKWYQQGWTTNNVDLAEEDLIECVPTDQFVEGSWAEESFNPAICSGMPFESAAAFGRPFNLVDTASCPYSPSPTLKRYQTGTWAWTRIPNSLLSVRKALTAAPVVMTVDSTSLGNGVGIARATASTSYDHYVAVVGYYGNVTTPYFLYKNSWASDWGESGYGRISVNEASLWAADGYMPLYA